MCSFFFSFRFFERLIFFKVPPSHMKVTTKDHKPHQRKRPPVDSVAAIGKCKQANEFGSRHYGRPSLIIHEQHRPDSRSRLSYHLAPSCEIKKTKSRLHKQTRTSCVVKACVQICDHNDIFLNYILCFCFVFFLWFTQTTKIILQRKFSDLLYNYVI